MQLYIDYRQEFFWRQILYLKFYDSFLPYKSSCSQEGPPSMALGKKEISFWERITFILSQLLPWPMRVGRGDEGGLALSPARSKVTLKCQEIKLCPQPGALLGWFGFTPAPVFRDLGILLFHFTRYHQTQKYVWAVRTQRRRNLSVCFCKVQVFLPVFKAQIWHQTPLPELGVWEG